MLYLGSGFGKMLCTWARDDVVIGTGIPMSRLFTEQARRRPKNSVSPIDSSSSMAMPPATCPTKGSMWRPVSVPPGSAGESPARTCSWREACVPVGPLPSASPTGARRHRRPTEAVAKGCLAHSISELLLLPDLLASFGRFSYDVVEMILADQDSWDICETAKWLSMRR